MDKYEEQTDLADIIQKLKDSGSQLKQPKRKIHWRKARVTRRERDKVYRAREARQAYLKAYRASPRGQYVDLKRACLHKGKIFELTFEDWMNFWMSAPQVLQGGRYIPAWKARGKGFSKIQLERIEPELGYKVGNLWLSKARKAFFIP